MKKLNFYATRSNSTREYIFSFKENDKIRIPLNGAREVCVLASEFNKYDHNFSIVNHDEYPDRNGVIYPVTFKVSRVEEVEEPSEIDVNQMLHLIHNEAFFTFLSSKKQINITKDNKVIATIVAK